MSKLKCTCIYVRTEDGWTGKYIHVFYTVESMLYRIMHGVRYTNVKGWVRMGPPLEALYIE